MDLSLKLPLLVQRSSFTILLFGLLFSCHSSKEKSSFQEDVLKIRKLPCDLIKNIKETPSLVSLYAVDFEGELKEKKILNEIENYLCLNVLSSINPEEYSNLTIKFLRESELTRKLKNNEVSDSHNPYSSGHHVIVSFTWLNGKFLYRKLNDQSERDKIAPKCD